MRTKATEMIPIITRMVKVMSHNVSDFLDFNDDGDNDDEEVSQDEEDILLLLLDVILLGKVEELVVNGLFIPTFIQRKEDFL